MDKVEGKKKKKKERGESEVRKKRVAKKRKGNTFYTEMYILSWNKV